MYNDSDNYNPLGFLANLVFLIGIFFFGKRMGEKQVIESYEKLNNEKRMFEMQAQINSLKKELEMHKNIIS